jgi:hypothetical protein
MSSRVDIYDIITQTWSTAQLSVARNDISAIANGDKIFFAGGEIGDGTWPVAAVDIYNTTTNDWSATQLSIAGHSITAAAVGNKVLFAGGDGGFSGPGRERRVDIYNLTTNSWSTAELSGPTYGPTAVTANDKVYFAGGYTYNLTVPGLPVSDKIEIYDNTTNAWSVSALVERRLSHGGIAVAEKIYWAGGSTGGNATSLLCSVEVNDVNTGTTVMQFLSEPSQCRAVLKNNKILFFSQNVNNVDKIEIYDLASGSWSNGVLPQNLSRYGVVVNNTTNTIYLTGGYLNTMASSQVWKLEF